MERISFHGIFFSENNQYMFLLQVCLLQSCTYDGELKASYTSYYTESSYVPII